MTTYRYDRVETNAYKRGKCAVCGKAVERSATFGQTLNPFNLVPDKSRPKTRAEIWQEIRAEARAWEDDLPVVHARCEGAR